MLYLVLFIVILAVDGLAASSHALHLIKYNAMVSSYATCVFNVGFFRVTTKRRDRCMIHFAIFLNVQSWHVCWQERKAPTSCILLLLWMFIFSNLLVDACDVAFYIPIYGDVRNNKVERAVTLWSRGIFMCCTILKRESVRTRCYVVSQFIKRFFSSSTTLYFQW